MKTKIIGVNYLHNHPTTEISLQLDEEHVIVDRNEWEEVIRFFQNNPALLKNINELSSIFK